MPTTDEQVTRHGERIATVEADMDSVSQRLSNVEASIATLRTELQTGFSGMYNKLDNAFVTKSEFAPVRTIAYGLVSGAGLSVLAYILRMLWSVPPETIAKAL